MLASLGTAVAAPRLLAAVLPESPFQRDEFDFISGEGNAFVHDNLHILIFNDSTLIGKLK